MAICCVSIIGNMNFFDNVFYKSRCNGYVCVFYTACGDIDFGKRSNILVSIVSHTSATRVRHYEFTTESYYEGEQRPQNFI